MLPELLLFFNLLIATFAFHPLIYSTLHRGVLSPSHVCLSQSKSQAQSSHDAADIHNNADPPAVPVTITLEEMLRPSSTCDPDQMGGTDLAYIGDVVFELFCRSRHVWPAKRTSDLQNQVVAIVRAEYQAALLTKLKETFPLTNKELQILMRGRNAGSKSKNRARNASAYQDATAFEALLGYLYISDQRRCQELLSWLHLFVDTIELEKSE